MSTLYAVGLVTIFMLIGLLRQRYTIARLENVMSIVSEFLEKYNGWIASEGRDFEYLNWLTLNMGVVQDYLGRAGLMTIRRPFENIYHRDMPILLNFIPEIRRMLGDPMLQGIAQENVRFQILSVDDCLRTYLGTQAHKLAVLMTRCYNPLALFCLGLSWIIQLPLTILYESKVISRATYEKSLEDIIVRLFTAISVLAALTVTFTGAIIGFADMWEKIKGWF